MTMALTALKLNYSVQQLDGTVNDYGKRLPNGTYNGYLYWLQQDYVDVVIAPFTMTEQRREDFDLLNTGM